MVCGHCVIRDDGGLVSQAGALQEVRYVFGGDVTQHLGEVVRTRNINGQYGFQVVYEPTSTRVGLGIFQTQYGWWDEVDDALIARAVDGLGSWFSASRRAFGRYPTARIAYQRGLEPTHFRSLPLHQRKHVSLVVRTKPPGSLRGFALVEGGWPG